MSKNNLYRDLITSRVKGHYYGNMNLTSVETLVLFGHPYLIYKNMFKHHSIWTLMGAGTN